MQQPAVQNEGSEINSTQRLIYTIKSSKTTLFLHHNSEKITKNTNRLKI